LKYILLTLTFCSFLFAHKINLFITQENEALDIYSYFANGAPCQNCSLVIKNNDIIILKDILDENGKYQYKPEHENIEVIIDAGGGHTAQETLIINNIKKEDIKTHQENEENKKYLNILLGLILIFVGFFILKKIKK